MFFRYKVSLTRSHGKIKQAFSKRQKACPPTNLHIVIYMSDFLSHEPPFSYSTDEPLKNK